MKNTKNINIELSVIDKLQQNGNKIDFSWDTSKKEFSEFKIEY